MLCEITIENVAVIEKAVADFSVGFTVLTGETGAGKSILIDSINAILGNRTSKDIVRSGANEAVIWARFQNIDAAMCEKLKEAGYECEDELLLYRKITADGKSTCRINGMPTTTAILRDVCSGLIHIHGQHDTHGLLSPQKHIGMLDAFAENKTLKSQYKDIYTHLVALQKEEKSLQMDEAEKTRQIDLLRYEVNEIENADLKPEEEKQLLESRNEIVHARQIASSLHDAYIALSGDGNEDESGAATLLADAARSVQNAAEYAENLAEIADSLQEMYYTATEMASDIQNRLSNTDHGEHSLDAIEERLDVMYRLKQKYGPTIEDVISYGEKARNKLESMQFSEKRLNELAEEIAVVYSQVESLAQKITQSRTAAFEKLQNEITDALVFLNMPGIELSLFSQLVPLGPQGQDNMELYISTNAGEKPKPLAKIASGGELARITLALKRALADRDDVPTVIYDEIDTGVSGLAAGRIGKLLRDTAGGRQVICVTHTAQVAACAKSHLLIEKNVDNGRTYTHIKELDKQGRVEELARIISGDNITDTARANAKEMMEMA